MQKTPDCRDQESYLQTLLLMEIFFQDNRGDLKNIRSLAEKIREGIEKINSFIQMGTSHVCPRCKDVCCISKHGYYNFEDLVYLYALGLRPPPLEFGRKDSEPCQFLTPGGCSLERPLRPSGCNWYLCDSLFDFMEGLPGYRQFDDNLRGVAELWMQMMEEFHSVSSDRT